MRVLYLNPSGQLGGAETSLLNLLSGLRSHAPEFRPFVVATEQGPFLSRCDQLGIPHQVLGLPARLERFGDSSVDAAKASRLVEMARLFRCTRDFNAYSKAMGTLLVREKPDVIHTNGFKMHVIGAWVNGSSRVKRRPALVGHIHDYVSTRPLAGKLLKAGSGRFSSFIANSRSVAGDVRTFLGSKRVSTVYNAIDLASFHPEGSITDLDAHCGLEPAPPGTVRIGLVATFAKWKGHLTFLRALARLSEKTRVRAYVIGGPIYRTASSQFSRGELEAEVSRLGLAGRVGFTGFLDDVPSAMRALDIVVHASTKPEPFGMTIIEAMACGRPVIVSNLGGAQELFVDCVSGFGHVAGDERDLARVIDQLGSNAALRFDVAKQAREHVMVHFPVSQMAQQVWGVYREALTLRTNSLLN
jgi:glycosyltransferase involved in cell wall biosynthesis